MQRQIHANGVITYEFEVFADLPVQAHISTRHGGVSPAPWNSLNFSVKRGDTRARVRENRQRFAQAVGVTPEQIVVAQQVHGTLVAKVDDSDAGTMQADADALMTDTVRLPLSLVFADCVPVVLYDAANHALAVCHSGWRGTVNGVAIAALWAMQAAYGTDPGDVWVGIGPSIGPQSYEVGSNVVDMAQAKLAGADRFFSYPHGPDSHPYFDLWQANVVQLIAAGVASDRIEVSGIDTAQNTQDFFSHRAEHGRCGLFGVLAWLDTRRPIT